MNSEGQYLQTTSAQHGNTFGSHLCPPSNRSRANVPGYNVTLGRSRPQFRRKLDSFLGRAKDYIFRNLDPSEVPRLESSEEESLGAQSYAVCPTLDLFLELGVEERIREIFRNVKIGDLVLAKVQSHVPDGIHLKLLCFDGPKRAFLEDLNLIGSCFAEDMTMKDPSDPCLQYEPEDTIRCEVLKICQKTRGLAIGMRGSEVSPEIQKLFPLGWVHDSELPQQYLYSRDRVKFKKKTTYQDNLAKRAAFNNPNVSGLASILGVNRNANSFFIGLRHHFPLQSMLPSLVQVQNKRIVQKKLDKALKNCRQCEFDEALHDLSALLVLDAENIEALIERGKIYADRNLCEKAKRDLQAAAKLLPDDVEQRKKLSASLFKIGVTFQKSNREELSLSCYEDCISILSGLPGALSTLIHLNEEINEFPSDLPGILMAKISKMKDELKRVIAEELMKEQPAKGEESMNLCDVAEVALSTLLEDGEVLSSPAVSGLEEISSCEREEADATPEELKLLKEENMNKEIEERSSSRKFPYMGSSSEPGKEYFNEGGKSTNDDRSLLDYSVTIQQRNSRKCVVENMAYTRREQTKSSRSSKRDRHGHQKSSHSTRSERGHSGSREIGREKRRRRTNSSGSSTYSTQQRAPSLEKTREQMNSSGSSHYSAQHGARKRTASSEIRHRRCSWSCEKTRERLNSSGSSNYSAQHGAWERAVSSEKERRRRSRSCEKRPERTNSCSSSNYSTELRPRKRATSDNKGRRRHSRSCEKRSRKKESNRPRSKSRSLREVHRKKISARAVSSSPANSGARNLKSTEEVVNEVEAYLQKLEKAAIAKVFSEEASTASLDTNLVVDAAHDSPISKHDSAVPATSKRLALLSTTPRINFALKKSKIKVTPDMVSVVFSSSSESSGSEDNQFTMSRPGNPASKPLPATEETLPAAQYSPSSPLDSSPDRPTASSSRLVPKETPFSDRSESSNFLSLKPLPDLLGASANSPDDSYSSHININEHQQARTRGVSYTRVSTTTGAMCGYSSSFQSCRSYCVPQRRDYSDGAARSLSSSRLRSDSWSRKSSSPNVYRVYSEKRESPDKVSHSWTSPGPRLRSTRQGSISSESSIDPNHRMGYRSRSRSPIRSISHKSFDTGRASSALQEHHPPGLLPTDSRFNPNYVSRNYRGKNPILAGRFQRT